MPPLNEVLLECCSVLMLCSVSVFIHIVTVCYQSVPCALSIHVYTSRCVLYIHVGSVVKEREVRKGVRETYAVVEGGGGEERETEGENEWRDR